jgi:uncharacterized membrane protein YfcA
MWLTATRRPAANKASSTDLPTRNQGCGRDAKGNLILHSRCVAQLLALGLFTGILAGMFGVGGGFVIVPALVLFTGMAIHRAVGTSLMVISLVSVTGVASQLDSEKSFPVYVTLLFVAGGIGGLFAGQQIGRWLAGTTLQKIFAIAMICVAAFVIIKNLGNV